MATNFWQGKLVRLRAIELADWETVFNWNLDSEMIRHLDFVWPPQSKDDVAAMLIAHIAKELDRK